MAALVVAQHTVLSNPTSTRLCVDRFAVNVMVNNTGDISPQRRGQFVSRRQFQQYVADNKEQLVVVCCPSKIQGIQFIACTMISSNRTTKTKSHGKARGGGTRRATSARVVVT